MKSMRWLLVALLLSPAGVVQGTSSLSFDGGGYTVELEIGDSTRPLIATVRFHAPGDRAGVVLARDSVTIDAFDVARQVLVLHHVAGKDGVAAFNLSVHGAEAVLETGAQHVTSAFDWSM